MIIGENALKSIKKIICLIMAFVLTFASSTSLLACNKEKTYTVTFFAGAQDVYYYDADGNKQLVPETGIVQTNLSSAKDIQVPVFFRSEYNFIGWDDSVWELNGDKVFNALWDKYNFTITYNGNGGLYNGADQVVLSDIAKGEDAFNRAPQFEREGYELYWDKTLQEFVAITSNCTINALWTAKTYTLTFVDENGWPFANNTQSVIYDQKVEGIEVTAPEKAGYKFKCWISDEDGLPLDDGAFWNIAKDTKFHASYVVEEENGQKNYTITYDLNGGLRGTKAYTFKETDTAGDLLSTPTRPGYDFVGWQINGGAIKTIDQITIDDFKINGQLADVHLKAEWVGKRQTLTLDAKDGVINSDKNSIIVTYGQPIEQLPDATKVGYVFDGWLYNGKFIKNGTISRFDYDATLEAKFLHVYKVKFTLETKAKVTLPDKTVITQNVPCTLISWGDLPRANTQQNILDVEIRVIEGQSLSTAIQDFDELPVVLPVENNEDLPTSFRYCGWWRWFYDDYNKHVEIRPNTVFTPEKFVGVKGGDVITLAPFCAM